MPADQNPYVLAEYQRKVREQEGLIQGMRKKFKKMNLAEKKGYIRLKEFELQRADYERQIQDLKKLQSAKGGELWQGGTDTESSVDERGSSEFKTKLAQTVRS